jgi:hypothetical protein
MSNFSELTTISVEGGWNFSLTQNWMEYSGNYSPSKETGFLGSLLTAKPKLFEEAVVNKKDYTITAVGENLMLTVDLKSVMESIQSLLIREEQSEDVELRKLQSRVAELEELEGDSDARILELEEQVGELKKSKKPGVYGTWTPTVDRDLLVRYACRFHTPLIEFIKQQVNTSEVEAFNKWMESTRSTNWQLTTEYLARVRGLSMSAPEWINSDASGNMTGVYTSGCWQVTPIAQGFKDRRVAGPFSHSNYHTLFYVEISDLEPLTADQKREHKLD